MKILIINGPNLNFLGIREVNIYGTTTYKGLIKELKQFAKTKHIKLEFYQSNEEGKIISKLQKAHFKKNIKAIILNAGAYTHTSYALYDAIKSIDKDVIEVHLSDIEKREDFRKISIIKPACKMTFKGEGIISYKKAIRFVEDEHK